MTSIAEPVTQTIVAAAPVQTPDAVDNGRGNGNNNGGNNGNNNGNDNGGDNGDNGDDNAGGQDTPEQKRGVFLRQHNRNRFKHKAKPLTYSEDLEAAAQTAANSCKFKKDTNFGEGINMAAKPGDYSIAEMMSDWMDEACESAIIHPQSLT